MSKDEKDTDPHVQADDAEAILKRAVELAAAQDAPEEERVSVAELERAAAEVGVPPQAVAAAVAEHAQRRRLRWALAVAGLVAIGCAGLLGAAALLRDVGTGPEAPTKTETKIPAVPPAPSAPPPETPEAPDRPGDALLPLPIETPTPPPAPPPAAAQKEPAVDPSAPGVLLPVPLSGDEAGQAQAAVVGTWQLVAWVAASGEALEVAASARPATEASAEVWHFLAGGRFRRTLGDDFATSGRWSVLSKTEPPQTLQWLGIDTWWLVALDQVRVAALPNQVRPRAWALVGQDGTERLIYYLGDQPDLSPKVFGARTIAAASEGARP